MAQNQRKKKNHTGGSSGNGKVILYILLVVVGIAGAVSLGTAGGSKTTTNDSVVTVPGEGAARPLNDPRHDSSAHQRQGVNDIIALWVAGAAGHWQIHLIVVLLRPSSAGCHAHLALLIQDEMDDTTALLVAGAAGHRQILPLPILH